MARIARLALLALAALLASAASASASDSMGAPTPLTLNVAQQADTTGFSVQAGEQNTTAPFNQDCNSDHPVGVGRTAWYTVTGTGGTMTVTTSGSQQGVAQFDTSLFVYSGSPAGALVGCNDDASPSDLTSNLTFTSTAGTVYAIQAGTACNDPGCSGPPDGGMLKVEAIGAAPPPPNHDLDGDGFIGSAFGGPDCNDSNPAIHPGATDVPHDGIDQDCNGADAPYPALGSMSSMVVTFFRHYTKVSKLTVPNAPAGAKVTILCSTRKRGCPFKSKSVSVTATRTLSLAKYLKHARLRKGALVTVEVTKAGFIGSYDRYSIRIRKVPTKRTRCLEPGSTKPRATCS